MILPTALNNSLLLGSGSGGLTQEQSLMLSDIYKAHFHRRNQSGEVMTIYEDDGTTPHSQFDIVQDSGQTTDITPR